MSDAVEAKRWDGMVSIGNYEEAMLSNRGSRRFLNHTGEDVETQNQTLIGSDMALDEVEFV